MKRAYLLAAVFCVGLLAALAFTAHPASASLDCNTDTAAVVASATVTDRGLAWSTPANPDPTWTVDMPLVGASIDLQAPDGPAARAQAKAYLESQVAALRCATTPTTTTAATVTAETVTVASPTVTVYTPVASPAVTVRETSTATVTTEAPTAPTLTPPPVNVSVVVNMPKQPQTTALSFATARCVLRGRRVACTRLNGLRVRIDGVWAGNTFQVLTANGS